MNPIENLVRLSQFYADRPDMNQAGGGNTSVKEGDILYIKGSGVNLSDVRMQSGYTAVVLSQVREILNLATRGEIDEAASQQRIQEANIGNMRPSIETFLHALLDSKYVLHLHTWVSMLYASSQEFLEDMEKDLDDGLLRVEYVKPGLELAKAMKRRMERFERIHGYLPNWVILQNHGIIGAGATVEGILSGLLDVHSKLLRRLGTPSNLFEKYCYQSRLKSAINQHFETPGIFLKTSEDMGIEAYAKTSQSVEARALFPDAVVYCGPSPVALEDQADGEIPDLKPMAQYLLDYGELPKIIFYKEHVYFLGESLKKCGEAEEVFRAQCFLHQQLKGTGTELNKKQMVELLSWEAEKFRQRQ